MGIRLWRLPLSTLVAVVMASIVASSALAGGGCVQVGAKMCPNGNRVVLESRADYTVDHYYNTPAAYHVQYYVATLTWEETYTGQASITASTVNYDNQLTAADTWCSP
jgi:hypothetical protein